MVSAHTTEPGSEVALHIMGPFLKALSHPSSVMVPGRYCHYSLSKRGNRLRELM